MKLSFVRVETWFQAFQLMGIRNECREGMTHHSDEITPEQQEKFWKERILTGLVECYLLYNSEYSTDEVVPIGFGLLRWEENKYWMTIGVARAYRGKHLSRLLTSLITAMGHREGAEVWLDVYDKNLAISSYIKEGYQFINSYIKGDRKVWVMRHEKKRILNPKEAFVLEEMKEKVK
jgi:hypothetical protein